MKFSAAAFRSIAHLAAVLLVWFHAMAADAAEPSPIAFKKIVLTDRYYCDGGTVGDINGDGKPDIVAGPFWYQGPSFQQAHEFYPALPLSREKSPSNSMFSFVHDFSGDGKPDILVLGRVHVHSPHWYENPGTTGELWEKHTVFERVRGESPVLADFNNDGVPQLICHWNERWGWLEPNPKKPQEPWKFVAVSKPQRKLSQWYHGEGLGDVNGDGRIDLIINDGWFEQPDHSTADGKWRFHQGKFSAGRGGAQMFAEDVDGDGDRDIISSVDAHGWGLAWYERLNRDGEVAFREHLIMGDRKREKKFGVAFSQPHALAVADMDGDGLKDIVTGKRMWAHGPKGDVEPNAAPVLYWFRLTRTKSGEVRYTPHLIDERSGIGVQLTVADVNGDKQPDILTASKLGTFLFLNSQPGGKK